MKNNLFRVFTSLPYLKINMPHFSSSLLYYMVVYFSFIVGFITIYDPSKLTHFCVAKIMV